VTDTREPFDRAILDIRLAPKTDSIVRTAGEPATDRPDTPEAPSPSPSLPRLVPELDWLAREILRRRSTEGLAPDAFDGSAFGVALCTLEGRFIVVNEALMALSGYSPADVVGRTGQEAGLWTDPEEMLRCLRQRGSIDEFVLPYRTRDGRTRRMLLAARLLTVSGRGCILAVGVDVTGRTGFAYEATL
jgi:PAS domain S-box-containing protein